MSGKTFSREEKLKSTKAFSELFLKGKSLSSFPFKVVYQLSEGQQKPPVQAAFAVSKRNFKKAVDRNRVKRLMREAYRLNKENFYLKLQTLNLSGRLILVFLGRELPDFPQASTKIILLLQRLLQEYEEAVKRDNGSVD